MSTESCCLEPLSPVAGPKPPSLPLELIWLILEQTLSHPPVYTCGNTTAIPLHILTLNRTLHTLVTKLIYRTIVISSSRVLARFLSLVTRSPHLARLVQNLWIGTPRLEAFAHQVGWVPFAVGRILGLAPGIRRLALPAGFFPPDFCTTSGGTITHVTANGGGIPQLPPYVEVAHVYGLVQPRRIGCSKKGSLRRVVCELKRPCAPRAVARFVQELLGSEREQLGMELELVVGLGLEKWLEEELLAVKERVFGEGLKVRVKGNQEAKGESYCDKWIRQ